MSTHNSGKFDKNSILDYLNELLMGRLPHKKFQEKHLLSQKFFFRLRTGGDTDEKMILTGKKMPHIHERCRTAGGGLNLSDVISDT